MNILNKYKIPLLLLLIFFSKSYGQNYKYKVKWDFKRLMGTSELFFYLNTGDSYPYNGNYANAATTSWGTFSYILSNNSVTTLDGVVVSNTPLRLTQALKEPSGSFTQRSGIYVTGPESGYWQNTFGSPLGSNMVTNNTPFEFYYLYPLVQLNNYNASQTELQACKPFPFKAGTVGEGGNMTFAVEYFHSTSGSWKELLPYERRNADVIPILLSQIPNLQLDQNFQLRVRYSRTGAFANDYSDILTYKFIPCPPAMIGEPIPESPLCYNSDNGKIIMYFDNDLANTEYFLLTLTPIVNNVELSPYNKTVVKSEFINRTIVWENLRAGTYKLKYQTFKTGNPTPSSIVEKNNIVITDKLPLSFQVVKTDAQCNNQNGIIRIEATGGTAPYYYTINLGSEVQFTSATNNINISGGTYNIKVRDTNNCIDLNADDSL
ncbi:hypothetical protein QE431_001434 [Flavobacterium sp. SORGH_AS 622]|nr:hypothetical protein [Flavobacterium sp. SORGH_AS_0622]